jgi:toluene monooxygenase system ferredoxin subunit
MTRHRVARLHELWDGEMEARAVAGHRLLLVPLDGRVHAYEDRCAHLGLPLSEGELACGVITCSAHHYRYDARTGRGIEPASTCLRRYAVTVEGDEVYVDTDDGARR